MDHAEIPAGHGSVMCCLAGLDRSGFRVARLAVQLFMTME